MANDERNLELKIQGNSGEATTVTVRTFARAAETVATLLGQVSRALHPSTPIEWVVESMRMGSTVMGMTGIARHRDYADIPPQVMESTIATIDLFERPDGAVPSWVTYPMADTIRQLGSVTTRGEVSLGAFGHRVVITEASVRRAKEIIDRRYVSFGSVEGTIETISKHESPPYFTLFHILDGYGVKCKCTAEQLEVAHQLFGQRVRVIGQTERRFDGKVDAMALESIRAIPPDRDLPTIRDIIGILDDAPADSTVEERR